MQCSYCEYQNPQKANYCSKCGKKIHIIVESNDYNKHIKKISFLVFALLAYLILVNFVHIGEGYINKLLINMAFAVIILIFYFIDLAQINKLFRFSKPNKSLLIKIIILAPLFAVLVSYIANLLNQNFSEINYVTYYERFSDFPAPFIFAVILVGIFPAIFEEIAFRGVVFNELSRITGLKSSIIISSILFTILHLSVLSIFWIFPIGLIFGYFRAKYRTLWYGIIGHFIYNVSIVLIEIIIF